MKFLLSLLFVLTFLVAPIACSSQTSSGPAKPAGPKIRLVNVGMNAPSNSMVIITGEAWNDDSEPMSAVITGSLLDVNGKSLVSGDQTLPAIPAAKGVPFNIAFPPNSQAVSQTVTVKSVTPVQGN